MPCSVTYLLLEIYCVYCFMVKYLETVKSYLTFEDQTWTLNRMGAILSICSEKKEALLLVPNWTVFFFVLEVKT